MSTGNDKIGVIREHRWLKPVDQRKRLEEAGCRAIMQLGKDMTENDLVKMSTTNRTFVFVRAFLLANPRHRHQRGGLLGSFNKLHVAITKRGSEVEDLDAGVTSQQLRALKAVVREDIARSNQGAKSAVNGERARGRPKAWTDPTHRRIMWEEWHSNANRTNIAAAEKASKRIGKYVSPNAMWKVVKEMRAAQGLKGKGASGRRPNSAAAKIAAAIGVPRGDGDPGPPQPKPKRGVVYFITNGVRGRVKIGFSERHDVRLKSLQIACPDDLTVIGTLPGTRRLEAKMHKRFHEYREKGEWFRIEGELAEFIGGLLKKRKQK